MKTYYRVQADIDLDAIYKNAENAKKLTKPGTKFMAIVKADAYRRSPDKTVRPYRMSTYRYRSGHCLPPS